MELDLLQISAGFAAGLILGIVLMLIFNKVKSGSASPGSVKQEFDDYKNEVEAHFEATSKKFRTMTEQYQDLYQHLSVGAATLCRPDSVAATLADESDPEAKPAQIESKSGAEEEKKADTSSESKIEETSAEKEPSAKKEPSADVKTSSDASKAKAEPSAKKEPSAETKEPSAQKEPSAKKEQPAADDKKQADANKDSKVDTKANAKK